MTDKINKINDKQPTNQHKESTVPKHKLNFIVFIILLLPAAVLFSELFGSKSVSRVFEAMSTVVTVQLEGYDAEKTADEIQNESERLESLLSMYREGSDIYNINHGTGPVAISSETSELLRKCASFSTESGGIFDTAIGRLTSLWGICTDNPRVPDRQELDEALKTTGGSERLQSIENEGVYYIENDGNLCIDLGGAAKGYALDCFKNILNKSRIKKGIISIGGNVLVYGDNSGKDFNVGLRIPEQYSAGYFCVLKLTDTVVSTTGGYERYFTAQDGTVYNHVIDPRTGYPVDNGLTSVSVICSDATRADYLSTRLFILGWDESARLFDELSEDGIYVVLVNDQNEVLCSRDLLQIMPSDKRNTDFTFSFR